MIFKRLYALWTARDLHNGSERTIRASGSKSVTNARNIIADSAISGLRDLDFYWTSPTIELYDQTNRMQLNSELLRSIGVGVDDEIPKIQIFILRRRVQIDGNVC